jgi:uncharacterized protein with LGFP repeats
LRPLASSALALLLVTASGAAAMSAQDPEAPAGRAGPSGSADPLRATTVDLAAAHDISAAGTPLVQTPRLQTRPYSMVAVTWRGGSAPEVQVRSRTEGSWTGWRELHALDTHAADRGTAERRESGPRAGTELMWVGPSSAVQARVQGARGNQPRLLLVDPGRVPTDPGSEPAPTADTQTDVGDAPAPRILSRSAWGADESWRNGDPVYNGRLKQAHIHHTAATNSYSRGDVAEIIRGDYWYHTQQLGWSDLGYNFVVDRFGRIWEGRAGGVSRSVRGAHTLGFNHASFGVAAIGNLDSARPSSELVTALVRLTAWKLDMNDRDPKGYARVESFGSDRYPEGTVVRLPRIDGHRDTNETACPGDYLYSKLPDIRRRAQARADAVYPSR